MASDVPKSDTEVFNYLTVLTSVVLGLGLTHLLVSYAQLIRLNAVLTLPWLYIGWIVLLLPLYFTYWWTFWDYRKRIRWSFMAFSAMLASPVALYLITALYLPDPIDQTFNAQQHYLDVRRWTLVLWVGLQIWGIVLGPWLKDEFRIESFGNRYKLAQCFLLVMLIAGALTGYSPQMDGLILIAFWAVLLYILAAHRRVIQG